MTCSIFLLNTYCKISTELQFKEEISKAGFLFQSFDFTAFLRRPRFAVEPMLTSMDKTLKHTHSSQTWHSSNQSLEIGCGRCTGPYQEQQNLLSPLCHAHGLGQQTGPLTKEAPCSREVSARNSLELGFLGAAGLQLKTFLLRLAI